MLLQYANYRAYSYTSLTHRLRKKGSLRLGRQETGTVTGLSWAARNSRLEPMLQHTRHGGAVGFGAMATVHKVRSRISQIAYRARGEKGGIVQRGVPPLGLARFSDDVPSFVTVRAH